MQGSVRTSISSVQDLEAIVLLHHTILAISNTCKGFPALSSRSAAPEGPWIKTFKEATEAIIRVLNVMSGFSIIREAVRADYSPDPD